jgi:hypothetical protein
MQAVPRIILPQIATPKHCFSFVRPGIRPHDACRVFHQKKTPQPALSVRYSKRSKPRALDKKIKLKAYSCQGLQGALITQAGQGQYKSL